MTDRIFDSSWVDRYVRDQLEEDEALAFEEALFESTALQADVEAALALRAVLQAESEQELSASVSAETRTPSRFQPVAMAASFLVGILGLSLWLQGSSEREALQQEIAELRQPYSEVVSHRLEVLRSAETVMEYPMRRPDGSGLLLLEVELSNPVRALSVVRLVARNATGSVLAEWHGAPGNREFVTLAVPAAGIDSDTLYIEVLDGEAVVEHKRLSFLP